MRIAVIFFASLFIFNNLSAMEEVVSQPAATFLSREKLGSLFKDSSGRQIQVKVANQFSMDNGKASCGYQALLNACLLRDSINAQEERSDRLEELNSLAKREDLFGSLSKDWQSVVSKKRASLEIKNRIFVALVDQFIGEKQIGYAGESKPSGEFTFSFGDSCWIQFPRLEANWDGVELKALMTLLSNVATQLACGEYRDEDSVFHYTINSSTVRQAVIDEIIRREELAEDLNKIAYQALLSKVDSYLNFADVNLSVLARTADWLADDEIELLVRALAQKYEKSFFVFGSTITRRQSLSEEEKVKNSAELLSFIEEFRNPQADAQAAFALYTNDDLFTDAFEPILRFLEPLLYFLGLMDENSQIASNTNGHWICVVVNKVDGQAQFLLANSAANGNIIDQKRVLELMEYLDGHVSPETESLHRGFWTAPKVAAAILIAALLSAVATKKALPALENHRADLVEKISWRLRVPQFIAPYLVRSNLFARRYLKSLR